MKAGRIIIICLVIIFLSTGCSYSKEEYEVEINRLKEQVSSLEDMLTEKNIENTKNKEQLKVYENDLIPVLEKEIIENEKTYDVVMRELEECQNERDCMEYEKLKFKKDIETVLRYLSSAGYIPIYEGEVYSYTQRHIELISSYFIEFSDDRAEDISLEHMDLLYPIIFPLKITETEVGFISQHENAYYYNVVHYMTYGMEGDYSEHKTIRAIGGKEDGFREIYIIEIYQENGEWKIGYTGFGS